VFERHGIRVLTPDQIRADAEILVLRPYNTMKKHTLPRRAPGGPGIDPRWTHAAKVAVGTAYSTSSRVWYTLDAGCVTEVYYPTIDTPQIRDLQFLFTANGKIERWHKSLKRECIRPFAPLTLEDARRLIQIYVDH
jgi:hypothetical protein